MSDSLLTLQRVGASWPALPATHLPLYIYGLLAAITQRKPEIAAQLEHLSGFLGPLPRVLGHGTLHPPNTQWSDEPNEPLLAVIDWEFAGARPLLLGAVNCMSCSGFKHPSGLPREFLALLPAMNLASRFGWISEWLRKNDQEMPDMELAYINTCWPRTRNAWPTPVPSESPSPGFAKPGRVEYDRSYARRTA